MTESATMGEAASRPLPIRDRVDGGIPASRARARTLQGAFSSACRTAVVRESGFMQQYVALVGACKVSLSSLPEESFPDVSNRSPCDLWPAWEIAAGDEEVPPGAERPLMRQVAIPGHLPQPLLGIPAFPGRIGYRELCQPPGAAGVLEVCGVALTRQRPTLWPRKFAAQLPSRAAG